MTVVPTIDAGFAAFRRALLKGYSWFAMVLLASVLVIDALLALDGEQRPFWVALPALVVLGIVAAVFGRTPYPAPWRVALLSPVVAVCVIVYANSVIAYTEVPGGSSSVLLSFVKVAVAIIGSMAERWTAGPLGTLLGFVLAEACVALGVSAAGAGGGWTIDYGAMITVVGVSLGQVLVGNARLRGRATASALSEASAADDLMREREALEIRSRALVHDTILNELAVLATTTPGPLSPRAVDQLQRSLELVQAGDLRVVSAPTMTGELLQVVEQFRQAGLDVQVSGDPAALDGLDLEVAQAVTLAVEQCLVNVVRHAQTESAELVVTRDGRDVSVMIIDGGAGFDPGAVAPERLGLAASVRGRIESVGGSVRIWSRPGSGTSILLSLSPEPRASAEPDDVGGREDAP